MIDTMPKMREHYGAIGLTGRIKPALATIVPDGQPLIVDELASLDQFHIRGMLATAELASAAGVEASKHVLDIGCGIRGPARSVAATFGCEVIGVDLSPSFIDAANYLTMRCGLSSKVTLHVGDALHLPFDDAAFDVVFLQHVSMNIADRTALYDEIHRILTLGGRFATYDLVLCEGDIAYPVPWARDTSASFLLSEVDTRMSLEKAGFTPVFWRDDTEIALDWFKMTGPPQNGMNLGVVMPGYAGDGKQSNPQPL